MDIFNSPAITGTILGLLIWSLIQSIRIFFRAKERKFCENRLDMANNQDYGGFLEIPLEQIVLSQPARSKKDLKSLLLKIKSFKRRNSFYHNKDFYLHKDFSDFKDLL